MPQVNDVAFERLCGWGNYPVESCRVNRPESLEELQSLLLDGAAESFIPRGLGRAYGDSALNRDRDVLVLTRFNRFLDFDAEQGVLHCEAGVSLAEIIDVFLPRGWFLPVTPGTKHITVGGAIAADVHGKNHHVDGSFGNFVIDFDVLVASGEVLTCSPSQHTELYWGTIGGMGLTGCILSARLRLRRVESAFVSVSYRRTSDLDDTLAGFESTSDQYLYSVAWIDCLATGKALGRSVLMLANDAPRSALAASRRDRPLALPVRFKPAIPRWFPEGVLNFWSVRLFNELYYRQHSSCDRVVDRDSYFYPLDRYRNFNRIYGRRGFVQYQALFPHETARPGLIQLLERLARSGRASFPAVLKGLGPANPSPLSFPHAGYTVNLDLANTGDDLPSLMKELDAVLLDHGGRLYLAKDALTTPEAFRAMYPRLPEFQRVKAQVDPTNRFTSSQARRVGIVES